MTDHVRQHVRLPRDLAERADARAERLGVSRTALIVAALRALLDGDGLESAVERVVAELSERGREDLAAAVAVATDPRPPEERESLVRELRRRLEGLI